MKKNLLKNKPLVCITSYNKFTAEIADDYCDLILVGDSMAMAYYGDPNTRSITLNDILRHGASVRKGIKKSLMVVDMPFGTYKNSKQALKNAKLIIKKTKCDLVKLEGGTEISNIIKALVKNKINVVAHIGLLPQRVKNSKDYKVKGKNLSEKKKLIKDFIDVQNAGSHCVVLEAIKSDVVHEISKISKIPLIGIGASKKCHGQIIVMEDMLGLFQKVPKFVKKYANLKFVIKKAIKKYSEDVKNKKFPAKKHTY